MCEGPSIEDQAHQRSFPDSLTDLIAGRVLQNFCQTNQIGPSLIAVTTRSNRFVTNFAAIQGSTFAGMDSLFWPHHILRKQSQQRYSWQIDDNIKQEKGGGSLSNLEGIQMFPLKCRTQHSDPLSQNETNEIRNSIPVSAFNSYNNN